MGGSGDEQIKGKYEFSLVGLFLCLQNLKGLEQKENVSNSMDHLLFFEVVGVSCFQTLKCAT